jgi:hypothetical protein
MARPVEAEAADNPEDQEEAWDLETALDHVSCCSLAPAAQQRSCDQN